MKAKVKDRIRIVSKMNDWSMEYQEGDIFTVESTWYGGVNVRSRSGVPISLDEVEYEILPQEEESHSPSMDEKKVIFHTDSREGFQRTLETCRLLAESWETEGCPGKIEVLAEAQALSCCCHGEEWSEKVRSLQGKAVRFLACKSSMEDYGIPKEKLLENVQIVALGAAHLVEKQFCGYAYLKF